ncbi:MAG: SLBB domain-containing protein [Spirochaetales bacterium]|nr:SLBB domain-containing protein [Spirochaetales bacterium]
MNTILRLSNRQITILITLLIMLFIPSGYAQQQEMEITAEEGAQNRVFLALSSEEYDVTPGDIYTLSYLKADELISFNIVVESDYAININVIGQIDGRNKKFLRLQKEVERKVLNVYPQSTPHLIITSVGIFQIMIKGEIPQTVYATAWGLSRLSEIVENNLGPLSSLRDIRIESKDGKSKTYDLLRARLFGDIDNDPYVKPGDTIVISRREREVSVKGEVNRQGKYQLVENENISTLLEEYARGITLRGDKSRIKIERQSGEPPEVLYIDVDNADGFRLEDLDTITVEAKSNFTTYVFFEGAGIRRPASEMAAAESEEEGGGAENEGYNRIRHPILKGETLHSAVSGILSSIDPLADLDNSYIIRDGLEKSIPVNIEKLISQYNADDDVDLMPMDTIHIPLKQLNVVVLGDVRSPGLYRYQPNKSFLYYIHMAGGVISGFPEDYDIVISDKTDSKKNHTDYINPGDKIIIHQETVNVIGAVMNPGKYPYSHNKAYLFYVNLAGGINEERNSGGAVVLKDSDGNVIKDREIINPGDTIYLQSNSFLYHFNRVAPVFTTTLGIITSGITIALFVMNYTN